MSDFVRELLEKEGEWVVLEKKREGRRAYDPHAHRTTASTNHKEVSPSKTVDEIEQPDKRQDSLHDTKDASSQERSIPTRDSN